MNAVEFNSEIERLRAEMAAATTAMREADARFKDALEEHDRMVTAMIERLREQQQPAQWPHCACFLKA